MTTEETGPDRKRASKRPGKRANAGAARAAVHARAWLTGLPHLHVGLGRAGWARTAGSRRAGLLGAVTVVAALAFVPAAGRAGAGPSQAPRAGAAPAGNTLAHGAPLRGALVHDALVHDALLHGAPSHGATTQPQGPFVTLLFSRTEMSAADDCVEDDDDIAPLDTTVAPYLYSLGMAGTGTLVTGRTNDTTRFCTHYNDDLTASWADATNLAQNYGWSFVSHTATYPSLQKIENLTPAQAYAETCGTIATIEAHGLPGAAGMIAYPGSYTKNPAVVNLQKQYGQTCFDWGRQYNHAMHGTNDLATASTTPPYWVYPAAVVGGPCNDPTQSCYNVHVQNGRYTMPSTIIKQIQRLQPGQWYILQAYLLVTGTNPDYTSNRTRWDCTSSDPAEHWTNTTVLYCWSDYQQIIQAIAADPSVTVTDPLTVGEDWGRPFS